MFGKRDLQPEIMDDPSLDLQQHALALRGLQRIHALSGTLGRLWKPLKSLIQANSLQTLSIMDVGCGDGLLLRQLWTKARRIGCDLRLVGCDFSSRALEFTQRACQQSGIPIDLYQVDITRQPLPVAADVLINSLFLHHFCESHVVQILEQFAAVAQRLVLIEDLLRSRLGYGICWLGVRTLTRSRVVHIDGPLSVRAAFSIVEMRKLLNQAGLSRAVIQQRWPERILISWQTTSPANHSLIGI